MLAAYRLRVRAKEAILNVAGNDLGSNYEQVIDDLLAGAPGGNCEWTNYWN